MRYVHCVAVDPELLLNVRETARRLGVHENTVRNWARQGILPEARVPGSRFHRFRAVDVEHLVTQRGSVAPSLQSERRAVNPELVSANQLMQWPNARAHDAQANFPELIRRLLVETPGISNISIRSGDGVALSGWDGLAESQGTAFLPAGQLAFEFGVDQNPKRKASEDYDNRLVETPTNKTFVFMTPRRWAGGPAWAEARRAEGRFADVRVLDADDLEGWLRATPGAHHWISEHLGLRPGDAVTIDAWWARFSASTDPLLPVPLFIAGRSAQADQLIERLTNAPKLTVIQSEWASDCLAFIYAGLYAHNGTPCEALPTIVVSAVDVWDRILEQPGQAVLIPQFDGADVGSALDKGHQVISIVDRTTVSRRAIDLDLPRLDRRAAAEAFQTAGVDFDKAHRLAVLGRRSLPALVRRLSRNPSFSRPAWAREPDAALLGPLVLVGAWTASSEDTAAVEKLTGHGWSVIEQTVRRVSTSSDPVLRKVGQNWAFTSPEEVFLLLRDSLTLEAIERWSKQVQAVLLAPDPMLDLAPGERLTAQMKGTRRPHSSALRHGLAQGLALMGAMGVTTTLDSGETLAEMAALTVRNLLDLANRDLSGRVWRHLADVLPLLAEAAPDTFLTAVEDDLASGRPALLQLFREEQERSLSLGSSSPHAHLLWALETVCWSEQHLIEGVRALARLAAIEPGGKSGNRPSASLATVLCGWVRNTAASLDIRLAAHLRPVAEQPRLGIAAGRPTHPRRLALHCNSGAHGGVGGVHPVPRPTCHRARWRRA
jgi:excisionase family DNA binding protein